MSVGHHKYKTFDLTGRAGGGLMRFLTAPQKLCRVTVLIERKKKKNTQQQTQKHIGKAPLVRFKLLVNMISCQTKTADYTR